MNKRNFTFTIPKKFSIFGQDISVIFDDNLYKETGFVTSIYYRENLIKIDKVRAINDEATEDRLNEVFFDRIITLVFNILFLNDEKLVTNTELISLFGKCLYQVIKTANMDLIKLCQQNSLGDIYKLKSFKLFGKCINVKFMMDLSYKTGYSGLASYNACNIDIQKNNKNSPMCKDRIMEAIFHEITHHIFDALEYKELSNDESIVGLVGFALHQFFKTME